MEPITCFSCTREDAEGLSQAMVDELGYSHRAAHTQAGAMAKAAFLRMEKSGDTLSRVPFCVTVEAEAFGAEIDIPEDECGPRSNRFVFDTMVQLEQLQGMDLGRGRIAEVLKSISLLRDQGAIVALNVEGPFTILSFLIDSTAIFRGIITHRPVLEKVLAVIEASLADYILAGFRHGAHIVSYADPTGAMEFFGTKLYRDLIGMSSYRLLKRLERDADMGIIHLCGQKSRSLEKVGLCTVHQVEFPSVSSYGRCLCKLVDAGIPVFIGHNCMKNTGLDLSLSKVWKIKLALEAIR